MTLSKLLQATTFLLLLTTAACAAEIRVLAANGISIPARELAPAFTAETGHTITFTFGSPGNVYARLAAGETYDLVVLPTDAARERESSWRPGTRKPLARLGIGVAVGQGARLDLSTVDSTRTALLGAKSIVLSDGGGGGLARPNAERVLVNLGIFETVRPNIVYAGEGQETVARGEAELGLFNISEVGRVPGVALAGPVPAEVQVYITYDAAIPSTNSAPDPAQALVGFLSRPATNSVWEKAGLGLAAE
jgi:molybdate transport system substrate-binding protein